jgi:hypothetical protein
MTLYRGVLGQAWQNAWRNKYLWFFGLFAALLGSGAEFRMMSETGSEDGLIPVLKDLSETGIFSAQGWANLGRLMAEEPVSIIIIFLAFLLLAVVGIFVLWLSVVSQGALVNNTSLFKYGKSHNFRLGLEAGISKFWPVFGLNAFLKISVFLVYLLLAGLFFKVLPQVSWGGILFICFFVVFVPVVVVLSFILKYAIAYVVVRQESFGESLRQGWLLFRNNWLVSLEMAFILFLVNFLAVVFLALLFLVLAIPFVFIMLVFSGLAVTFSFWFLFLASAFLYVFLAMWLAAVLTTFQVSAWTILFIELVSRGGVSKLVRLFGRKSIPKTVA